MTVVHEYPAGHAPDAVQLLPDDAQVLLRAASNCAFKVPPARAAPGAAGWDWCFLGAHRAERHPQYISLACRSRGASDEAQEVLYDTHRGEYVVSVRAYLGEFTPETIVKRVDRLADAVADG